ncbi:STAS domain-containing protein [Streptomyces virginiae]|uniref:STAS domain-containing protein n=2 Tax=Streptomyces virginiae TaxID=1961 RepID=UPI00324D706C
MEQLVLVHPEPDGVRVITCSGEFDADTLEPFRQACAQAAADPHVHWIILDVTRIAFADSSMLNELIKVLRTGRRLVLAGPLPHQLDRLFDLTSAHQLFTITDKVEAARELRSGRRLNLIRRVASRSVPLAPPRSLRVTAAPRQGAVSRTRPPGTAEAPTAHTGKSGAAGHDTAHVPSDTRTPQQKAWGAGRQSGGLRAGASAARRTALSGMTKPRSSLDPVRSGLHTGTFSPGKARTFLLTRCVGVRRPPAETLPKSSIEAEFADPGGGEEKRRRQPRSRGGALAPSYDGTAVAR